jgi:hypothetical protein
MDIISPEDMALQLMDRIISESIYLNEDGTYSQTDPFTMSQKSALSLVNMMIKENAEINSQFQSDKITERISYWLKIKEVIENM